MNDAAFVYMDLMHHGLAREAFRFLDRYLERTGDYGGLDLLRFYAVYRAMVRAKVACVRMAQAGEGVDGIDARRIFDSYLALATRLARREAPVLVLMHGVSASGKSVASQRLLEALGAVRLRSDVERKRMQGLAATARAAAAPGEGLYSPDQTDATYARLEALARAVLAAGYAVVIDATFLERPRRDRFRTLAAEAGAAFEIACCRAPVDVLRGRIELRMRKGDDASDADLAVLDRQLAVAEALGDDECVHVTVLDTTSASQWHGAIESFARRFRMPLGPP
jgi:predicted kinase